MSEIPYNLAAIHKRMELACKNANRDTAVVKLLLATKTISAEKIKIALGAGETLIGENKVQELKEKFDELKKNSHQTHFIGHLQSRKVKLMPIVICPNIKMPATIAENFKALIISHRNSLFSVISFNNNLQKINGAINESTPKSETDRNSEA